MTPAAPAPLRQTARLRASPQSPPHAWSATLGPLDRRLGVFGGNEPLCSSTPFAKPPDFERSRKAPPHAWSSTPTSTTMGIASYHSQIEKASSSRTLRT